MIYQDFLCFRISFKQSFNKAKRNFNIGQEKMSKANKKDKKKD